MKTLKYAILLLSIITCSNNFAKSPHDSESLINSEITEGKVIAAEYDYLSREVVRLKNKLEKTLEALPVHLEHTEGKIIAIIANQVEINLNEVKKDIEGISYQKTSDPIYTKLEQIEKDIEMI